MKLSIVIPSLNESAHIEQTLLALQPLRTQGQQIILADGGSQDNTVELAKPLVDTSTSTPKGRAKQMNHGAQLATGDVLLFLHADTILPDNATDLISAALKQSQWGRFDVRLSGQQPALRMVEFMMNWRSHLTGIATGDQAIFVTTELFKKINGFPEIALMEDIALSKTLKSHDRPGRIKERLTTSSRRWEDKGIGRTIFLMWRLRLAYFFGADPQQLVKLYR